MKPVHVYAEVLEQSAMDQFNSAMARDFTVKGALMPDAHTGYSLPIGAVVATDGVVVPSWVGYDIGCGMCALPINVSRAEIEQNAYAIFQQIYKTIPVGFSVNALPCEHTNLDVNDLSPPAKQVARSEHKPGRSWQHALGSLGGGNHFIEVGADATDRVWVVIHSGSRGIGHGIASYYMKQAAGGDKVREGHYSLRVDSELGQAYLNDLDWALRYALDNRKEMLRRVALAVDDMVGSDSYGDGDYLINRNHNHATLRNVDGQDIWIHRKGATHAEEGMLGVIPGNMRDGSFIVRGKGNPDSLYSSSHGAGRVLGRKKAKEQLSTEDFTATMTGITAKVDADTLDESPMAYKDIFEVMRLQADLVEVVAHVRPIINIKG